MSESIFHDPFARPPAGQDASTGGPVPPGAEAQASSAGGDAPAPRQLTAEVPLAEDQAVEAFLEYPHLWWPAAMRACGEGSHVGLEEGLLVEEGEDGRRHSWARIGAVDAEGLHFRWVGWLGRTGAGPSCDAVVGFEPAPGQPFGTVVTVTVSGPASSVEEWAVLMSAYARFSGGRPGQS